ncbi:MAG: gas vesicle protein [Cyanobacteria bacterium J007]|nr:MAG: gas vesicle protein [Cyanobacteria bacterium J007]
MSSTPTQPKNYPSSSHRAIATSTQSSSLADILERVLDKGIVIAGDISISIATTELLHIRIRLLISSVDKAKEMGINWWENDPYLSSKAQALIAENQQLQERLNQLETEVRSLRSLTTNPVELRAGDRPPSESSSGEASPDSPT